MFSEALIFFVVASSIIYNLYKRAQPPVCQQCNRQLEEYYSIESDVKTAIGLTCFPCKNEWIVEDLARQRDREETSRCITLNDTRYYYREQQQRRNAEEVSLTRHETNVLKHGDHIKWKRFGGVYYHHAIVVGINGDDFNVIEFSKHKSAALQKVKVTKSTKSFLAEKNKLFRLDYDKDDVWKDDVQIVIARSFYLLNKRENIWYNLLKYNCESLSTFCVCGTAITHQGQSVKNILANVPYGDKVEDLLFS